MEIVENIKFTAEGLIRSTDRLTDQTMILIYPLTHTSCVAEVYKVQCTFFLITVYSCLYFQCQISYIIYTGIYMGNRSICISPMYRYNIITVYITIYIIIHSNVKKHDLVEIFDAEIQY